MKKSTKVLADGKETGIRIEEYRQEDDSSWLASRIAEAYNSMYVHQENQSSFIAASQAERQKAISLQNVIFQLKERERNGPPEKISRMDPLSGYDMVACELELQELKARAQELQSIADDHGQKVIEAKNEIAALNKKIREVRSSG